MPASRRTRALLVVAVGTASLLGAAAGTNAEARRSAVVAQSAERVRYTGPSTLRPPGALSAAVAGTGVAAVTFVVDGRPFATDSKPPYSVPVLPAELSPGRHAVRVVTVARSGSRTSSAPVQVVVGRTRGRVLTASPRRGLAKALAALGRGNVVVRLLPGRYELADVRLGSGASLVGGPGVVVAAPARAYAGVLRVDGERITVSGIAIDGGGAGDGDGQGILVGPSSQVVLRRIRVVRPRGDAIYLWGRLDEITVQDSDLDGGGRAWTGVTAGLGDAADVSVVRTRIARFRGFGVNFAQARFDLRDRGLRSLALDNVVSDIREDVDTGGRSQGGIWTGGALATILGNRISGTGLDGIETVGTSDGVVVARNTISGTPTGIYVEHQTTRSVFRDNVIRPGKTGINVEWRYQGRGSGGNAFLRNHISGGEHGIFIDTGSDENSVVGNRIFAARVASIVLQGSSRNTVEDNRVCGPSSAILQKTGLQDDGTPLAPAQNRLAGNSVSRACGVR